MLKRKKAAMALPHHGLIFDPRDSAFIRGMVLLLANC